MEFARARTRSKQEQWASKVAELDWKSVVLKKGQRVRKPRRDPSVLTKFQRLILKVLDGTVLTAEELAAEMGIEKNRLYQEGGIKELTDDEAVINDRKVGGYYRPDAPPS